MIAFHLVATSVAVQNRIYDRAGRPVVVRAVKRTAHRMVLVGMDQDGILRREVYHLSDEVRIVDVALAA